MLILPLPRICGIICKLHIKQVCREAVQCICRRFPAAMSRQCNQREYRIQLFITERTWYTFCNRCFDRKSCSNYFVVVLTWTFMRWKRQQFMTVDGQETHLLSSTETDDSRVIFNFASNMTYVTWRYFWEIVHEFSYEEKKKLLFFATGSDRVGEVYMNRFYVHNLKKCIGTDWRFRTTSVCDCKEWRWFRTVGLVTSHTFMDRSIDVWYHIACRRRTHATMSCYWANTIQKKSSGRDCWPASATLKDLAWSKQVHCSYVAYTRSFVYKAISLHSLL